jgi:cation diffusion facilitator CzcD-associated flavoprotein CzcO
VSINQDNLATSQGSDTTAQGRRDERVAHPSSTADLIARVPELRAKYRRERDKRMQARPEGGAQYIEMHGAFADFDRDPNVAPGFTRDAIVEETDIVIIGAGFGGMLTAANLHKQGIHNYRMIDRAGDFGGTWYWNRYPGCMCDVESYCYLPMLEETGYMPKQKYAHASEIFEYCQLLARKFEMYPKALFQTDVNGLVWDELTARWTVTTSRNDRLRARFVVLAGGILHKAKLPGIPGIHKFQGHVFHTSRWDYAYTGGGPEEAMTNLRDKRVAIVGTGATSVQVVPKLAGAAKQLYVFQRTPSAVGHRGQRTTDPAWFKQMASKPGWQDERTRNFIGMVTGKHPSVDMVADGWTELLSIETRTFSLRRAERERLELIDFQNMEKVRARVDAIVTDKTTADALKPWYGQMCKRPCFHDDYLPAFNRPNVKLVDTEGMGVERITETGIVAGGVEYPVDLIVFASGFEVATSYWRLGFDPVGTGGVPMSKAWAKGATTLHGVHVRGFPNLLLNGLTQGGQAINFAYTISETAKHIAFSISRCLRDDVVRVEPKRVAAYNWLRIILSTALKGAAYTASCTPGYFNNEGRSPSSIVAAMRSMPYMGSAIDWARMLEQWRTEGAMRGLALKREPRSVAALPRG